MPPLIEFGGAEGLAYKHNFQQDIANQFEQERLNRTARQDAENRAHLFGDMFQFGEATNTYNKKKLTEFTDNQLKDIGRFINDNGGYANISTNPALYGQFKNMTHKLLDNDWVKNDMAANQEYASMVKFLHDNPGSAEMPEFQNSAAREGKAGMLEQWQNYKNTGDIYGRTGIPEEQKLRFMFNNPASNYDMQADLAKYFGQAKQRGMKWMAGSKSPGYYQFVTEDEIAGLTESVLSGTQGIKIKAIWNAMKPEEKEVYRGDIRSWVKAMGRQFVPTDKVKVPENLRGATGAGGSGAGGAGGTGQISTLRDAMARAYTNANTPIHVPPIGLIATQLDKDNVGNFDDATLIWGGNMDGTGNEIRLPSGIGQTEAIPTGYIMNVKDPDHPDDPGRMVADYKVRLPLQTWLSVTRGIKLNSQGDNGWTVIDSPDLFNYKGTGLKNDANWRIHDGTGWGNDNYSKSIRRIEPGTNGNKSNLPMVEITMRKPISINEANENVFNKVLGVTKDVASLDGAEDESQAEAPEFFQNPDGTYTARYSDGTDVPVTKEIVDKYLNQ